MTIKHTIRIEREGVKNRLGVHQRILEAMAAQGVPEDAVVRMWLAEPNPEDETAWHGVIADATWELDDGD